MFLTVLELFWKNYSLLYTIQYTVYSEYVHYSTCAILVKLKCTLLLYILYSMCVIMVKYV